MNESCHVWMSHVTYDWVTSHMNESCHIWMARISSAHLMSCQCVTPHVNESCHVPMSHVPFMYPRVISHFFNVWHDSSLIVKRDLHKNESCHISIYQRVTPPFFWSQLAFELGCVTVMVSAVLGELCVWHEWVLSHIHESCHIWMSHVPFFFFCRSWHSSLALVLQWWVQCLKSCIIMCSRATFRCQVRQIRFKRDLYTWKETCKKRSAYSKSYGTKYSRATFQWQVRKIRVKRDLCTWKETYSKDPLFEEIH